jgi:hypothetical protein
VPGLGVERILALELDPSACMMIGKSASDRTFADRLHFAYSSEEFFET